MNSIPRFAAVALVALLAGATASSDAQTSAPPAPSAPAPAAAASSPAPSSPAKKELVRKALQLQQAGIEGMGPGMASQAAGQVMQMAAPAVARIPEEKRRPLVNDLQAEVRKFQNEVTPILRASAVKWAPSTLGAGIEEKLTEDELKVLIAWLESPVSRKYQQISGEAQQALTQKVITETRPQIEPKLKALEQSMVAKLNAANTASASPAPGPGPGPGPGPAQPAKK